MPVCLVSVRTETSDKPWNNLFKETIIINDNLISLILIKILTFKAKINKNFITDFAFKISQIINKVKKI